MPAKDKEPLHIVYGRAFREKFYSDGTLQKKNLIAPAGLLVAFLGAISAKALLNDPEKAEIFLTKEMGFSSVVVDDSLFASSACFLGNDFTAVTSTDQSVSGTFCWYGFFEEKTEISFKPE